MSLEHHTLEVADQHKTLAAWGVTSCVVTTTLGCAGDEMVLTVGGRGYDAPMLVPPNQLARLRDPAGVVRFAGFLSRAPTFGGGDGEGHTYVLRSPWMLLERRMFLQGWRMPTNPGQYNSGTQVVLLSRAILNQELSGNEHINVAQQLQEAAGQSGFPAVINVGSGVRPPESEVRDMSVAEVLHNQLRWVPAEVARWQYASASPVMLLGAPVVSRTFDPSGLLPEFTATPRYDLMTNGVRIDYISESDVGDSENEERRIWGTVVTDSAGNMSGGNVLRATVNLRPGFYRTSGNISRARQEIEVATNVGSADWWGEKIPWWNADYIDDFVFEDETDGGEEGGGEGGGNNELIKGTVTDWMKDQGVWAERRTATAKVSYKVVDPDDDDRVLREVSDEVVTVEYTATNATTRTYTTTESIDTSWDYEEPEPVPQGIASSLMAGWGRLYWDMRLVFVGVDVVWAYQPGERWSLEGITGGDYGLVRSITRDIANGRTTVECGPPSLLGPSDWLSLLRPSRLKRDSGGTKFRRTGKKADTESDGTGGGVVSGAVQAPSGAGQSRQGGRVRQMHMDADGEGERSIHLDPELLPDDEEEYDMRPRAENVCLMGGVGTRYVLATEARSLD